MGRTVSGSETERGMSDEATGKSGKTWFYVLGTLGLVVFLYVLSIGPSVVLRERRVISYDAVNAVYEPLGWMMAKTGTGGWSIPYIRVWLKMTGTPDPNDIP